MKRHAKASSTGSTMRQAKGLGRIVRGVLAFRASSPRANGSGAPAGGPEVGSTRPRVLLALLALALLAILALGVTLASAEPPTATIEAPTNVSYTHADVSGTLDPADNETYYCFEYAKTADLPAGWSGFCYEGPLAAGSGSTALEEHHLTGLAPGTEYATRLTAINFIDPEVHSEEQTFTTLGAEKPTIEDLEVDNVSATEADFTAQVNPNGTAPDFQTTWSFSCSPTCPVGLAGATIDPDTSPHEIANHVLGLQPNTDYTLTAHATNVGGERTSQQSFHTPAIAPAATTAAPPDEVLETAQLHGYVNPNSSATHYWFEWGTADCSANPCTSLPAGEDADVGAGPFDVSVYQVLEGLQPQTTYHYRLLAESAAGTTVGADREFTTLPPEPECANRDLRDERHQQYLANCRAYEMVSPPDKNGGQVAPQASRTQAAADCSQECGIVFPSLTGFSDPTGMGITAEYLASRDPAAGHNGWVTKSITPFQEPTTFAGAFQGMEPKYASDFSPDLHTAVFRALTPLTADPSVAAAINLYTLTGIGTSSPPPPILDTPCPACSEPGGDPLPAWINATDSPYLAGTSADLRHVAFETTLDLVGAGAGVVRLYEADAGSLRLLGLVPPAGQETCGGSGPACVLPTGASDGSIAGDGAYGLFKTPRVVSTDGARVNFTAPVTSSGGLLLNFCSSNCSKLYQRDNHGTPSAADDTTTRLDLSERVDPLPPGRSLYQIASADGHRVFFANNRALTDDAPEISTDHLYMYDFDHPNDEVQRLTVAATAGQYRLALEGEETADLPFDATPAQIAAALESLSAVSSAAGQVSVTGGPADSSGSSPYFVTFRGGLSAQDLPTMTAAPGAVPLSGGVARAEVAPWVKGGGHLTLIDVDREHLDGISSLQGVLGASADGSYLYFTSFGQLVPGKTTETDEHFDLWHNGEIIDIGSAPLNSGNRNEVGISGILQELRSRVTPDGKHLLFGTNNSSGFPIPGYPHGFDHGGCLADENEGPCTELYLYDAASDSLDCVSCDLQHLAAPGAGEATTRAGNESGGMPINPLHFSHALSDDGRFVFFNSAAALVPRDTNGVTDAYAYDSRTRRISLISSGVGAQRSYFLDATDDGSDVFVATKDPLSGWDTDPSHDLYDARIDGGLPEPPPPEPPCAGDSCHSSPAVPPPAPPVGSGRPGPGNPPSRCPAGTRLRRVDGKPRCLKRRRPRHHRHHHRATHHDRRASR